MKYEQHNKGFTPVPGQGQVPSGTWQSTVQGFTLLELLIVIAIIAILSAILIFVLNPAETLRKGRDSQRISDLSTINRAIAFYITTSFNPDLDGDNSRGDCGTHAFVGRGSSPDITATSTAGLTLSQPDGDSATSTVDGFGWIPVDFSSISGGSPVPRLPLDPAYRVANPNDVADNDLLYIYGCDTDTTYELNANLESNKFSSGGDDDRESTDGGNNPNVLEVGTKLTILGTSEVGTGEAACSADSRFCGLVTTDKPSYLAGEKAVATITVTLDGLPAAGVGITLMILRISDGANMGALIGWTNANGQNSVTSVALPAGEYRAWGTASDDPYSVEYSYYFTVE